MAIFDATQIRALVFDVFGTVVDWRSGVARDVAALAASKGVQVDAPAFADAWRAGYRPAMDRARRGEIAWTNIDGLHRSILNELLPRFGLGPVSGEEADALNRSWHRLDPWPDALSGLHALRTRFVVSTLSNGNVALLVNMAKRAGLPWDCVLSAEMFQKYKPDPEVYTTAAHLLGFTPQQVLMVAAHPSDLAAAQRSGLRTAYVPRPFEYGAGVPSPDRVGELVFDIVASDFVELAARL